MAFEGRAKEFHSHRKVIQLMGWPAAYSMSSLYVRWMRMSPFKLRKYSAEQAEAMSVLAAVKSPPIDSTQLQ